MTATTGHPYGTVPAVFRDAPEPIGSTIADELALYEVHLQAENKSRATVSLWTGAARQLAAYLADHGMPTAVRAIRREHLESWLAALLAAGGLRRHRGVAGPGCAARPRSTACTPPSGARRSGSLGCGRGWAKGG